MKSSFVTIIFTFMVNSLLFAQIYDIKSMLDQCPTNDPAIDIILTDFEIRLNGELVTEFSCSEPVSEMDTTDYTNPLIYLQTLRVIYYMDMGMTDHLPWTDTTLYVWMKNAVDGINIVDGVTGGYCCTFIDGKKFFVIGNTDGSSREFDKKWIGISGNIGFVAHEARHADSEAPGHTSCCGIPNGCDQEYNENNLGTYGVQYWLNESWLTGNINVGARTSHSQVEIDEIINWHLSALNNQFRNRFCENIPDIINIEDIDYPLGSGYSDINLHLDSKLKLYPNPFATSTTLSYSLKKTSQVQLSVFNQFGQLVYQDTEVQQQGEQRLQWDASNQSDGLYFYRLEAGDQVVTGKLVKAK